MFGKHIKPWIKSCSKGIIHLGHSYFCIKLSVLLETILGKKFDPRLKIAKTFLIASRLSSSISVSN